MGGGGCGGVGGDDGGGGGGAAVGADGAVEDAGMKIGLSADEGEKGSQVADVGTAQRSDVGPPHRAIGNK